MIFFMCCCVFAWSFSLILPLPADCAHEHGHIEGALLLTSLNISYFIMRNKPRTLSLHHGRFHSESRMEPYFWLWTVFSFLEQSDEQKMNTNYFLDISKSFKSAQMMKTLRLLLMQTMFWFNISNDVFNIKMWNSYLSFVCAWWFFCAPVSRHRVRTANKFERRYENHNNHANCCYKRCMAKTIRVFWLPTHTQNGIYSIQKS